MSEEFIRRRATRNTCVVCGEVFLTSRNDAEYCSSKHRVKHHRDLKKELANSKKMLTLIFEIEELTSDSRLLSSQVAENLSKARFRLRQLLLDRDYQQPLF